MGAENRILNKRTMVGTIQKILTIATGIVFLSAAIGKIFSIENFIASVSSILLTKQSTAASLSYTLVILEFLGGLALLTQFRVAITSLVMSLAVAFFIVVLSRAILVRKQVVCHCFGIWLDLSNRTELALDFILLNGLISIAFLDSIASKRPRASSVRSKVWLGISVAVVLYLEVSFAISITSQESVVPKEALKRIIAYAEESSLEFSASRQRNRLILLMNYEDLSCPLCLEDFLVLNDTLGIHYSGNAETPTVALFKQESFLAEEGGVKLRRWATSTSFLFPAILSPKNLPEGARITKSHAVVVSPNGEQLFYDSFPMGESKRRQLVQLIVAPGSL